MSEQQQHDDGPIQPTRRQQLKPFEYLAFAAVAGAFVGLVILLSVRDVVLALVFGGVGFIGTLLITRRPVSHATRAGVSAVGIAHAPSRARRPSWPGATTVLRVPCNARIATRPSRTTTRAPGSPG